MRTIYLLVVLIVVTKAEVDNGQEYGNRNWTDWMLAEDKPTSEQENDVTTHECSFNEYIDMMSFESRVVWSTTYNAVYDIKFTCKNAKNFQTKKEIRFTDYDYGEWDDGINAETDRPTGFVGLGILKGPYYMGGWIYNGKVFLNAKPIIQDHSSSKSVKYSNEIKESYYKIWHDVECPTNGPTYYRVVGIKVFKNGYWLKNVKLLCAKYGWDDT